MKRIICLVLVMMLLFTSMQVFAATYYDINIEGLTATEKREVTEWLEDEGYEYDVESYSEKDYDYDDDYDYDEKVIVVEDLSSSKKNTLTNWLKNRDYDYTSKMKGGYYYVTIEYTSSTRSKLINYLEDNNYYYDTSDNDSSSSDRTGKAYLVSDGYLWYVDSDDVEKVDTIYSPQYVLFTRDGAISYINKDKYGKVIEDIEDPTETEKIATSVKSIVTNTSGYATSFKSSTKTTKIGDEIDNDEVTVYVVKNNTLYSLESDNDLVKIKSLKSISGSYTGRSNIGFSEWGDLVIIDSYGVCFFNETIDETDEIETMKDQKGYTVKANYFNVKNGIIQTVILSDGTRVTLEDD